MKKNTVSKNIVGTRKSIRPLATAIGYSAILLLPPCPSWAQDRADVSMAEPVVITGSNLQRSDYEGPQRVVIYDRKRIEQSGARTVSELLLRLPENTTIANENVYAGFGYTPGSAAVSLRGLGEKSTLVLINGRRLAPFPLANADSDTFVDLNGIPLAAVERVEILEEGASAIYGSDAVAGVVNLILKQNYNGGEAESSYGNTTTRDASEFRQSVTSGISNEKFHVFFTGNYFHRNSIADSDRSFSHTSDMRRFGGIDYRSKNANPGTVFVPQPRTDSVPFAIPRGSDGKLTLDELKPATRGHGDYRNLTNGASYNELVPESERWGGLLTFGYNLTPHLEVFGEVSYQSVQTKTKVVPTPISTDASGFTVGAQNPFNPFKTKLELAWLPVEIGPRLDTVDLDSYRYLGGLRLNDLPHHWLAEAAVLYSESNVVDYSHSGFLRAEKVQAALNDSNPKTALNVFGDGRGINNPRTLRKITATPRTDGESSVLSVDARANGDLFELPAGAVKLGVAGEYRSESSTQTYSESLDAVLGLGTVGSNGDRTVSSAAFEVSLPVTSDRWNIPLLRALEFTIAERYDDYSDFGGAAKPKFGFKWKPLGGLLFRGSYSEGFRAPSLPQLYSGTVTGFTEVVDRGAKSSTQIQFTSGGNPALLPETSYSYVLGAIVEPPFIHGLSLEAAFYRIEQRNLIALTEPQDIVDGRVPGTIVRGANGLIQKVNAPYANLGTVVVDGVDLDLAYRLESRFGELVFDTRASFMNSFEQRLPGAPNRDSTDTFILPEFKMTGMLTYTRGGFGAVVAVNYVDSYDDEVKGFKGEQRTVGSWTTVDLQASYEWPLRTKQAPSGYGKDGDRSAGGPSRNSAGWWGFLDGVKLTLGVLNVGDSEPPFANTRYGYDPQVADGTGRFVYASVRKIFW